MNSRLASLLILGSLIAVFALRDRGNQEITRESKRKAALRATSPAAPITLEKIQHLRQGQKTADFAETPAPSSAKSGDVFLDEILAPLQVDIYETVRAAVQSGKAEQLRASAQNTVSLLANCLRFEDRCAQKQAAEGGYFNPEVTGYHYDLARAIETLKVLSEIQPQVLREIPADVLVRAVGIQNDNVPLLATELLMAKNVDATMLDGALSESRNLHGRVRALFYDLAARAAQFREGPLREHLIAQITAAVASRSDTLTAVEVQESLARYELTASEYQAVAKESCHLAASMGEDRRMIVRDLIREQIRSKSYPLKVSQICVF